MFGSGGGKTKTVAVAGIGEVVVARRRGVRRISLRVRADGSVRVSMPALCSVKEGLRFVESKREWIIIAQAQLRAKYGEPKPLGRDEERELRAQAQRVLPAMVAELAAQYGFQYGRVSVRKSRSRWGSCSGSNDISLSIFLVRLPEHLQRFVVLHELCHTRHHNHSVHFHALLNQVVGGREKELNRELKNYKIRN